MSSVRAQRMVLAKLEASDHLFTNEAFALQSCRPTGELQEASALGCKHGERLEHTKLSLWHFQAACMV